MLEEDRKSWQTRQSSSYNNLLSHPRLSVSKWRDISVYGGRQGMNSSVIVLGMIGRKGDDVKARRV